MKKRIALLAVLVFVAGVFVSVSEVKAAVVDNSVSMSASHDPQEVACGEDECPKAKEDSEKTCPKKDSCEKKESCEKSGEQKKGCCKSQDESNKKMDSGGE